MPWYIEVQPYSETAKIVRRIGPYSTERLADKADTGVNRQIDADAFFTVVVELPEDSPVGDVPLYGAESPVSA